METITKEMPPAIDSLKVVVHEFIKKAQINHRKKVWTLYEVVEWCETSCAGGVIEPVEVYAILQEFGYDRVIRIEGYVYEFYFDEDYVLFRKLVEPFGELVELHGTVRIDVNTVYQQVNGAVRTYYSYKQCQKMLKRWCYDKYYSITRIKNGFWERVTELFTGEKVKVYEVIDRTQKSL